MPFFRATINFINEEDVYSFKERFDGYVFVDNKGNFAILGIEWNDCFQNNIYYISHENSHFNNLSFLGHEYPAIVEFAPNQKIPKNSRSHKDAKNGTIDEDSDYIKFLENLENPVKSTRTIQQCLEDIDAKEKELKSEYIWKCFDFQIYFKLDWYSCIYFLIHNPNFNFRQRKVNSTPGFYTRKGWQEATRSRATKRIPKETRRRKKEGTWWGEEKKEREKRARNQRKRGKRQR